MRVGACIFCQNYGDWDRYEAEERHEDVPPRPEVADRSIFYEEIEIARQADRLGFDSVWTIEHHFTPYTMVTNPVQLLSYLAGVTERVDLGTMVIVLPWHNPVRVAEDLVMLDALLGEGRSVIAGVGRGLGRREYNGLGIDQNEARGRFDEAVKVLRQLLATGECTFEGQHFRYDGVRLRPQPAGDLSGILHCAAGSPETMAVIAAEDIRPLMIPTVSLDLSLQGARHYMGLRDQHGLAPTSTKLALWVYCAESEDEAAEAARRHMHEYADSALRHYEMTGTHFDGITGYEGYAERAAALRADPTPFLDGFFARHPWGTPEMVTEKITELAHQFGTSEIMGIFRYGSMGKAEAMASMELFAERVLPEVQRLSPAPMSLADA